MPPAKDDRVRKDKKEKDKGRRRGSTGTELVSDSDIGTPQRTTRGADALMDLLPTPQAEAYCTQDHSGRDSAPGVAVLVPPPAVGPPGDLAMRASAPKTAADADPITKGDLASLQHGLALMLQNAVAEGIQGLKQAQEKQGARLSALEESNRALADKIKKLESDGTSRSSRAASVLAPRQSVFAPVASANGARAVSEHAPRRPLETADASEKRARQCILSGFKDRFTLPEFRDLIPTLTDKEGAKLQIPLGITYSASELYSDKIRLEFATEWERRTFTSSFVAAQPKHQG
eukprot:425804-Amphidinium_carterae.2